MSEHKKNSDGALVLAENSDGLAVSIVSGTIPSGANLYAPGCMLQYAGGVYYNSGTAASPSFNNVNSISSSEIASGAVSLEHLDSGVAPAFICVGAVLHTWDGGAATTDTATITGVLASDIIVGNFTTTNTNGVTIEQIARTGTDTVTITTSGNAADNDIIAIAAFRAAA